MLKTFKGLGDFSNRICLNFFLIFFHFRARKRERKETYKNKSDMTHQVSFTQKLGTIKRVDRFALCET